MRSRSRGCRADGGGAAGHHVGVRVHHFVALGHAWPPSGKQGTGHRRLGRPLPVEFALNLAREAMPYAVRHWMGTTPVRRTTLTTHTTHSRTDRNGVLMKGKAALVVGMAAGYVLGTRDGRERYEQIKSQADRLWNDPKVQKNVAQAQDVVKEKAPGRAGQGLGRGAQGHQQGQGRRLLVLELRRRHRGHRDRAAARRPRGPPSTTSPVPPATPSTTSVPGDQKLPGGLDG